MSLFEAVLVYLILILVLKALNDKFSLVLFGFMASFISLSIASIFDSTGTFAATTFSGTVTQQTWLEVLYGCLTLVSFYKAYLVAWKSRNKPDEEV